MSLSIFNFKKKTRLLWRVLVFCSVSLVILGLLYVLFHQKLAYNAYPVETFKLRQLLAKTDSIEAITIGHSHNVAIDFSTLGMKGYHIWHGAEDVFQTKFLIEELQPKLPNLKIVFMPIAFFFRTDNGCTPPQSFSTTTRIKFYTIFPFSAWIGNDIKNWLRAKLYFFNNLPAKLFSSQAKDKQGKNLNEIYEIAGDGQEIEKFNFRVLEKDHLIESTRQGALTHRWILKSHAKNSKSLKTDTTRCLEELIRYLQKRKIRIILYTPPYYSLYTEIMGKEIVDDISGMMKYITAKYDVEYYDYSADQGFINNVKLFCNGDHLNLQHGAREFSRQLLKDIQNRK